MSAHPCLSSRSYWGGAHENERRAGTENVAMIVGLAEAMCRFVDPPVFDRAVLSPLVEPLASALKAIEGVSIQSPRPGGLANTLAFTVEGTDSTALLASLDLAGICASSGSACAVGSLEPSHVLQAMSVPRELAGSLVRFSLGRENTPSQIATVAALLPEIIAQVRGC